MLSWGVTEAWADGAAWLLVTALPRSCCPRPGVPGLGDSISGCLAVRRFMHHPLEWPTLPQPSGPSQVKSSGLCGHILKVCLLELHRRQKSSQEWCAPGFFGLLDVLLPEPDLLGLGEPCLLGRMDTGVLERPLPELGLRGLLPCA